MSLIFTSNSLTIALTTKDNTFDYKAYSIDSTFFVSYNCECKPSEDGLPIVKTKSWIDTLSSINWTLQVKKYNKIIQEEKLKYIIVEDVVSKMLKYSPIVPNFNLSRTLIKDNKLYSYKSNISWNSIELRLGVSGGPNTDFFSEQSITLSNDSIVFKYVDYQVSSKITNLQKQKVSSILSAINRDSYFEFFYMSTGITGIQIIVNNTLIFSASPGVPLALKNGNYDELINYVISLSPERFRYYL